MDFLNKPLQEYLLHRFGSEAQLEKATQFTRGSSRQTWFVDYRPTAAEPVRSVVFRSDYPGGSTNPTPLAQEYFMYERLGQTEVPVAKAIAWEGDSIWASRPFYIREQVEGSWDVNNFANPDPRYDELRIATSKEHLEKLALVHNVNWKKLGFYQYLPAPDSVETCALHFIDTILQQLESFQQEPMPVVVEGVARLRERSPVAPRICLCKGTNGRGEEVFRDGKIVAMSDWEEASIGDPAADFASLQEFVPELNRNGENIWGLEKALEYYHSVSGINVTVESVRFYQMVRALGTISFAHNAATKVIDAAADIRQIWAGTEVVYYGKMMLAASIGLGEMPSPDVFLELNQSIDSE